MLLTSIFILMKGSVLFFHKVNGGGSLALIGAMLVIYFTLVFCRFAFIARSEKLRYSEIFLYFRNNIILQNEQNRSDYNG